MVRRLACTVLLVAVLSAPATAEESAIPILGEHRFVPVMTLVEPFITTHIQMGLGLGSTLNATQPLISPIDSTLIGTTDSDQFFTTLGFRYQQGVREWLAVVLSLDVAGRLGTDTSSLLNDGLTGSVGYRIGWLMRAYHSETVLVSGSLSISRTNATFVNVSDWFEGQQSGEEVPLVQGRTSLLGSGGVHAAWGISHRFGLLGALEARYGESFDGSGNNDWYSDVRIGFSYDSSQDLKTPLGFALTAGRSELSFSDDPESGTWFWSIRMAAIGRSDFTVGLELMGSAFDTVTQEERVQTLSFQVDIRYFY